MSNTTGKIKALGEVSIRVRDLDAMDRFYQIEVGLQVLRREENFVFYKISEGYAGHPQVLNLFAAADTTFLHEKSPQLDPAGSTLHHIALNIALEDYESEKERLEGLGLDVRAVIHEWLHVRSLYFADPEGNLIEFVCHDERVG